MLLFFDKSTFPHAGQREKKSFFHAAITFFHAGITFFHAGITFLHARIAFFHAGDTFLAWKKFFEISRILICCKLMYWYRVMALLIFSILVPLLDI
jgi:hypothetical protein